MHPWATRSPACTVQQSPWARAVTRGCARDGVTLINGMVALGCAVWHVWGNTVLHVPASGTRVPMEHSGTLRMCDNSVSVAKALIRRQTQVLQPLETRRGGKQVLPTKPLRGGWCRPAGTGIAKSQPATQVAAATCPKAPRELTEGTWPLQAGGKEKGTPTNASGSLPYAQSCASSPVLPSCQQPWQAMLPSSAPMELET